MLNCAIIGCGRIAHTHAKNISAIGRLVAVCDSDNDKGQDFANRYNAKYYSDYSDLLREQKPDLVCVCTPNGLHAIHSIAALHAGSNVLCEKPMAITLQDAQLMISAAESAGRKLFIVKQNRYNPPVLAVRNLVAEGKLGQLYNMQLSCFWNRNEEYYLNSWHGSKTLDGGTLFTQFSHFIDLLYWFAGPVAEAKAWIGNFGHKGQIEFEDTGVALLRFESGTLATINYTVNSFKQNMEGSLAVFGERGTVKIGGQYLNTLEYQQVNGLTIKDLPAGNPPNNYGAYMGSMSNHHLVYENVARVLTGTGEMMTTPEQAMESIRIIHQIYDAANSPVSKI